MARARAKNHPLSLISSAAAPSPTQTLHVPIEVYLSTIKKTRMSKDNEAVAQVYWVKCSDGGCVAMSEDRLEVLLSCMPTLRFLLLGHPRMKAKEIKELQDGTKILEIPRGPLRFATGLCAVGQLLAGSPAASSSYCPQWRWRSDGIAHARHGGLGRMRGSRGTPPRSSCESLDSPGRHQQRVRVADFAPVTHCPYRYACHGEALSMEDLSTLAA